MILSREAKERIIENFLVKFHTYKIGLKNCQRQLDYIMPSLTARYDTGDGGASFYISNNTEKVAMDRLTSKKALDLLEEIEQYKVIIDSIEEAMRELNEQQTKFVKHRYFLGQKIYEVKEHLFLAEDKAVYRIRRQVLEKFLISLNNLINLK
jgi:RinA family phage transcriptional activator